MLDQIHSNDRGPEEVQDDWGGAAAVMDDPEEQRVLFAALDSFYQYSKVAHYNTTHLRRQSFYALPQAHWKLLAAPPFSYLDTLNAVDDAIDENAELATAILQSGLDSFGFTFGSTGTKSDQPWRGTATSTDLDKARSTLRQFYRDWSSEGAAERAASLSPVIASLRAERSTLNSPSPMTVLVPGAGLGRLVFDLCNEGFNVEGNEISYHQLLASSYILNYCPGARAHTLYPWIHTFSNHSSRIAHLQSVLVPDIHPGTALDRHSTLPPSSAPEEESKQSSLLTPGEMSMSASDFLALYNDAAHESTYDAVATVFFLDTAPNPIRYIETIRHCLKPGGIWTNLGPLLWHFENNPPGSSPTIAEHKNPTNAPTGIQDPGSLELTDDEILTLVERLGFSIEKRESGREAGYIQDPESMLQSLYRVSHWVARKV